MRGFAAAVAAFVVLGAPGSVHAAITAVTPAAVNTDQDSLPATVKVALDSPTDRGNEPTACLSFGAGPVVASAAPACGQGEWSSTVTLSSAPVGASTLTIIEQQIEPSRVLGQVDVIVNVTASTTTTTTTTTTSTTTTSTTTTTAAPPATTTTTTAPPPSTTTTTTEPSPTTTLGETTTTTEQTPTTTTAITTTSSPDEAAETTAENVAFGDIEAAAGDSASEEFQAAEDRLRAVIPWLAIVAGLAIVGWAVLRLD